MLIGKMIQNNLIRKSFFFILFFTSAWTTTIYAEELSPVPALDQTIQQIEEQQPTSSVEASERVVEEKMEQSEEVQQIEVSVQEQDPVPSLIFKAQDVFFEVLEDNLPIFENSNTSSKQIGYLLQGQIVPRLGSTGEWHKINLGDRVGYVSMANTKPASGSTLHNINTGQKSSSTVIKGTVPLSVYDNTSGKLVPFGVILKDVAYSVIGPSGDWYRVDFGGRIGYIYKPATKVYVTFSAKDNYFEVTQGTTPIYSNTNKNKIIGYVMKGQVYPRLGEVDGFHKITFANNIGYIEKKSTKPATGSKISNRNTGLANSSTVIYGTVGLTVYDNTSGRLIPYGVINQAVPYPVIKQEGNWYKIDLSGRIGYIYKPATKVYVATSYDNFEVVQDSVPIYNDTKDTILGYVTKGQIYPRVEEDGNWHKIKFGSGYGFVSKAASKPGSPSHLKNLNKGESNSNQTFVGIVNLSVYDNTSGSLVPFGTIKKGVQYPLVSVSGDWYKIDLSGRLGYVYKPATKRAFTSKDKYFQTFENNVPIYENNAGTYVQVGYLLKGQVIPRVGEDGDYHKIQYGKGFAYVPKDPTNPTSASLPQPAVQTDRDFIALQDLSVYDNSTGKLIPFAVIHKEQSYPIVSDYGRDWYKITIGGRIGFVYKGATHETAKKSVTYQFSDYSITLNQMNDIQNNLQPLTDKRYDAYLRSDALTVNNSEVPSSGTVISSGWRVRGGPGTNYWMLGTLGQGEVVQILSKVVSPDGYTWYKITYNQQWLIANPTDTAFYINPVNSEKDTASYMQFLSLSKSAGLNVTEVNDKILKGKGILEGKGNSFIQAGQAYNVNEIYLIAHSLLETGQGYSKLSQGILVTQVGGKPVTPKVVYNMYGVGAIDYCSEGDCPNKYGSEYAYKQGWFTPEAAIIGGAKFIAESYINVGQDTLYKMRWNPANPGTHQYATDIGWAYKQVSRIHSLYNLLDSYTMTFDVPRYQ